MASKELVLKNKKYSIKNLKHISRNPEKYLPYLMIAPTVLLIMGIVFIPIMKVFDLSFQDYQYTKMYAQGYIGLKNFKELLFKDALFKSSLFITLKWVVYEVALQLIFGMILALLLNREFKGRGLVRAIVLVPWAVSGVLTTMLWSLMYNQHIGVINDILLKIGFIKENVAWLANPNTVFPAILTAELWRGIPFFAITLLAAMQSIPKDVYEAAEVDGCGPIKSFIYITLPFLKECIVLSTLLRGIWEFNSIDMIFTMTNGGPMDMTTTLPIYMMKTSIIEGNYGYGSTIGVVAFMILLSFAIGYLKVNKFGSDDDE